MSSENPQQIDAPPLTEEIAPGTATDPPVGSTDVATVTVDGTTIDVAAGATLLDAIEAVETDDYVPALCSYDRHEIGPRSECRTCMVETDEHGVVPACSFPAEDGLTVQTGAADAAEARDVNLDLVLSDHNLRCTTCGKNGRCELQDAAIEQDVEEPRYGVRDDRDDYEPIDDSSSFIQIDRNKCILCNRCVEACNDVQVEGVLRMEGSGQDTRIGFQSDAETMEESTCVSCGHCVTVCPTGSLVEKGIENATTIPLPGFTQKNSVGKTYESTGTSKGPMTPKKRTEHRLETPTTEMVDSPTDDDTLSDTWDDAQSGGDWL
ncbi:NADH:ubiquinone oxidoreductase, subunit G, iron- sulphur binding protein (plasmid) [Haloterrigena turkmenica DSM 5511]|uniref:NADH:ubiquinone oxidoreductase, subunit G, iron-sulphur binding protein n=1 Tax=Haloterrigena turkmenica (strain ATCC 51198 / DSM 5511 / JCM 9101 / NCIMB 13204 / VKM B-1734 / 4k) TaxID=543526 RepID=D2S0Q0_HALTV|nr:2Fe-2S iron-sulfur cluster-binding protein [Haloterrigena turkmenica]ADB62947.1 NADH:ubiquinone oxidoreductase, subunit G, iron- sulphur binding protein [Haloterrigena turkmenica DSM 5511]